MCPVNRITLVILLLATLSSGQTLQSTHTGENAGDRSGSSFGWGALRTQLGWSGCSADERLAIGAPGWSSNRGRVEFWLGPSLTYPVPFVHEAMTGDVAGDRFGAAMDGSGNFDGGPKDWVVGAPGGGGWAGYVRAVSIPDCPPNGSASTPTFTTLWTVWGAPGDQLGFAVAVLGDVNGDGLDEVLVGAPFRDNAGLFGGGTTNSGAVFVLSGADGSILWGHNGSTVSGYLGYAIEVVDDVDGDGKRDYLVGEPGYDVGTTSGILNQGGRVRVYSGANGAPITSLWMYGDKANAQFGRAIAAVGDVDLDGVGDFCIGSPLYDQGSFFMIPDTGRIEVRSGADGSLVFAMNGPGGSRFGTSIDGGFDYTNDGYPEIVAGGPTHDSDRGMVRVVSTRTQDVLYEVTGGPGEELGAAVRMDYSQWRAGTPGRLSARGGWRTYESEVQWGMSHPFGDWGSSLAILDDIDGDGWDDFAVGQYHRTNTYLVPIWEIRSGRTSAVLHPFSSFAQHGHQVACLGDVDGDGVLDIAHATPWEGVLEVRSGADPNTIIRSHVSSTGTWFGHAMADSGDVNGDGVADYIVGEPGLASERGLVRVYSGATGLQIRSHLGEATGDELGFSVTGLGDVDGDGWDDYGAGAPFANTVAVAGKAYVWSGFDGSLIWSGSGSPSSGEYGRAMCGPGDVDGDGLADFAVSEPFWEQMPSGNHGRIHVFKGGVAGSGHPAIHTIVGSFAHSNAGYAMTAVGDVDRDGVGDFAASNPRFLSIPAPTVTVYSGATATPLFDDGFFTNSLGTVVAGRGGAHADGRQELLVGAPDVGMAFMWFLPEANSEELGSGCGTNSATPPQLSLTPPKLGQLTTLDVDGFQSSGTGAGNPQLLVSNPVAAPQLLNFGCEVWLDIPTASLLTILPGNVLWDSLVPDDVTLAGVRIHLQVVATDNNAPLGIVLSNGVALTFGF